MTAPERGTSSLQNPSTSPKNQRLDIDTNVQIPPEREYVTFLNNLHRRPLRQGNPETHPAPHPPRKPAFRPGLAPDPNTPPDKPPFHPQKTHVSPLPPSNDAHPTKSPPLHNPQRPQRPFNPPHLPPDLRGKHYPRLAPDTGNQLARGGWAICEQVARG